MAAVNDWSWVLLPQSDQAWKKGYEEFEKAFPGKYQGETVRCPRCREFTDTDQAVIDASSTKKTVP